jgi:hypothetical protein
VPDLKFEIEGATPVPFSETPLLAFKLRIDNRSGEPIHSILLRCQVMIEAARRRYSAVEQEQLRELFGTPEQWSQTLHSTLWNMAHVLVPPFTGGTSVDLHVACTFDFNVAATKYFAGLQDGEVPLCILFSGTVFYEGTTSAFQVAQIPWDRQAEYRLPVRLWRDVVDLYYPNTVWICLRRDEFDRLQRFKTRRAFPTWEQALEFLLQGAEEPAALENGSQ